MAMGYIDREEAIRAIEKYEGYFQEQLSSNNLLTKIEAMCIISDVDDADVVPVRHGSWKNIYGDFSTAECSVCKSQFEVTFERESNGALWDGFCEFYHYCPNCGAKMEKED